MMRISRSEPSVIVITGLPATGKTTVGRRIATDLNLPFISRDHLKETLFDSLGWSDRTWSRSLGKASWRLLYLVAERLLEPGVSFVIESNFDPALDGGELRGLQERYPFHCVQVRCVADGPALVERFMARPRFDRHPGHVDAGNLDEVRDRLLHGSIAPLDLRGVVITVDTTDWASFDHAALLAELRGALVRGKEQRGTCDSEG